MLNRHKFIAIVLSLPGVLGALPAQAHHSFAVYYDAEKMVSVSGTVQDFRFTNPHAIIHLKTTDAAGAEVIWTVETTAPVFMARRGWSRDTIKAGEQVTIEGWHSRDGSNLMRMRAAFRPDGTQIAGTVSANDE